MSSDESGSRSEPGEALHKSMQDTSSKGSGTQPIPIRARAPEAVYINKSPKTSFPRNSPSSPSSPSWMPKNSPMSCSPQSRISPAAYGNTLRRKASHGANMQLQMPPSSPPSASWLSHSEMWTEGQFSASGTHRMASPLSDAHDQVADMTLRSPPPMAGPDVVDSVWLDPAVPTPSADEIDILNVSPALARKRSGTLGDNDKAGAGYPKFGSLSLNESPTDALGVAQGSPTSSSEGEDSAFVRSLDSPPKTRSHIALPPRSGYALSDDSDSVRSEGDEGSAGSERDSTDSGSDNDLDTRDDDDNELDESELRIRKWQMARLHRFSDDMGDASPQLSPQDGADSDEDSNDDEGEGVQRRTDLSLRPSFTGDDDSTESGESDEGSADGDDIEDSLSCLERIFLFAKSDLAYHRVLVSRCLAEWIREVDLTDAVEYVIPLLNGLATDELEVSSVFAPELGRLMWFFFRNCPLSELDYEEPSDDERMPRPKLSVSTFTSLLCTLLLNPNSAVSGATQASIVEYFLRSKMYDEALNGPDTKEKEEMRNSDLVTVGTAREKLVDLVPYEFGAAARTAVLEELFEHVAMAIARVEKSSDQDGSQTGDQDVLDRNSFDEESALGRMMSVNMLAAITVEDGFSVEQLVQRVVPEITSWPLDPAFYVRKEVAAAIGIIGKAITNKVSMMAQLYKTTVPQRLFDAINRVLLDHVWQVRQAACYSIPGVFATQPPTQARRENLVILMKALEQDVSPNVQLAAFEMIGEVIYLFHNDANGVPEELVRAFLGQPMDKSSEEAQSTHDSLSGPDRALIVAFNFPAVMLTLGRAEWPRLRDLYIELSQHEYDNVRHSLAASLHEMAKLLGPDVAVTDLIPVADQFLQDTCIDVTATLLEHIDEFWLALPPEAAKKQLQMIPSLWMGAFAQQWHLREKLASKISSLVPTLLLVDEEGCLVTMLLLSLNDNVDAMRQQGIQAVPITYATFRDHDPAIADGFLSMICDLAKTSTYRKRVTFLHVVAHLLINDFPQEKFEQLILPVCLELVSDSVLDVQMALAKMCRVACELPCYAPPAQPCHALAQITATLLNHKSQAVRTHVQHLTDRVNGVEPLPQHESKPRKLELGPARQL